MEFSPLLINAHYPGIDRGLTADVLASRALDGASRTVCTTHIVASHGTVTDVLNVPTDTVNAQLEHIFEHAPPTAAKVGIIGHPKTIEAVFKQLDEHLDGPLILDATLSGPSGEDLIGQDGIDALGSYLDHADLVSVSKQDAELLAGMQIPSLDDAQVAVQRIEHNGAKTVLLRCGQIATHHFDTDSPAPDFSVDLLYDGDEFSLFEAPILDKEPLHGASSALLMKALAEIQSGKSLPKALQQAKGFVTEAIRRQDKEHIHAPDYFWSERHAPSENGSTA